MVVTFDEALAKLRAETDDQVDVARKGSTVRKTARGKAFEELMLDYFKRDSIYSNEFTEVKLWYDWYHEPDRGIDIVARDRRGNLVGIQCKCWADDATLPMDEFTNMFAVKNEEMDRLLLVFTGHALTKHAQTTCEESKVVVLMQSDLRKSSMDWDTAVKRLKPEPLQLMKHQEEAVTKTICGFKNTDRGQLVMACGTGKTLTSLHIAEKQVGIGGLVLYLVPSISLISQTMREWANNASVPHQYIAVCSDKTSANDEQGSITEIPIIPSTSVDALKKEYKDLDRKNKMGVVFAVYNSVGVATKALLEHDQGGAFDLILFDEAHKTTGVQGVKEKYYMMAHHNPTGGNDGVPAKKRLYMTATPRVYNRVSKKRGTEMELKVYSMDDTATYGDEFYRLDFSEAVYPDDNSEPLLSEYRIRMREVDEGEMYGRFMEHIQEGENPSDYGDIDMDYLAKVGGICKAITYPDGDNQPPRPLQRIMVFHQLIKKSKIFAGHGLNMDKDRKPLKLNKGTKKTLSFDEVANRLMRTDQKLHRYKTHTRHVDGKTNSRNRGERIDWLRLSSNDPTEMRLLSNARCLQEGVDVPALDAVAFMDPKKSPIDIIQSIGRVMRKSEGKKYGYVIIPIPVLKGDNPRKVIDKNKKYEQVNLVLQAILAHDNQLRTILNNQMLVKSSSSKRRKPTDEQELTPQLQEWIERIISGASDELLEEIKTVLLELGDSSYYKKVGEELGEQSVIIREKLDQQMKTIPETADTIRELHQNLQHVVGSTITLPDTTKALAQHAVMYRVFVELFPGYDNPIAAALNKVMEKLNMSSQLEMLEKYYLKIKHDIDEFKDPVAKQEFIRTIYDAFFRGADRKSADKHGIVYTPIEIVDFIIHSIHHVLETEFNKSFNDECVKILDPFTGTGAFITQLMESGLIHKDKMLAKYKNDIYASEIMLPAYYVAMANIESSYQAFSGEYIPFENISYMDTFDQHPSYHKDESYRRKQITLTDDNLKAANDRTRRQGMELINVIMGNPPYSGGQKSANENNPNIKHVALETRIKNTYKAKVPKHVSNKRGLDNSYIKAIRWASDRIGESGVIGLIMPSAWLKGNVEAGIRACIQEEFTDVYCFDLRGDAKAKGEQRKREAGNVFGMGSREATVITILVKNPQKTECKIHYHDIGDYLSRDDKLQAVIDAKSVSGIDWCPIPPNKYHDWLNQRGEADEQWQKNLPIGSKGTKHEKTSKVLFSTHSRGLATSRDGWAYNTSKVELEKNMRRHIDYCNEQDLDNFVIDQRRAKKNSSMIERLKKLGGKTSFNRNNIRTALYKPFFKQHLYFDHVFVHEPTIVPPFFPHGDTKNPAILVPDKAKGEFSTLITEDTPDLNNIAPNQIFPLKTAIKNNRKLDRSSSASSLQPPASSLQPPASSLQPPASSLQPRIWRLSYQTKSRASSQYS